MKKVWKFARELAAVDYTLKQAKLLTGMWATVTVMSFLSLGLQIVLSAPAVWLALQLVTTCVDVIFLRGILHRLARARAKTDKADWEASMYKRW